MEWDYEAKEDELQPNYARLPEGEYSFQIDDVEPGTKKGTDTPQAAVYLKVIDNTQWSGNQLRYHTVTFPPDGEKGRGLALQFLKSIGQTYQGKFKIKPYDWIGKKLKAYVIIDEYQGVKRNKIKMGTIKPYETTEEENPFGE